MDWSAFWGAVVGAGGVLAIERAAAFLMLRRINRRFQSTTPPISDLSAGQR